MPFPLNNAIIRNLAHVRVERLAAQDGKPCRYQKIFKPAIGADGDGAAAYWILRENEFLLEFAHRRLRHAVQFASAQQTGGGGQTAVLTSIETLDAGVTVEDWLTLSVRFSDGRVCAHPFQPVDQFLHLLRACLSALAEIHAVGIVHCDIKADNICLPHQPYPCQGGPLRIAFDKLRLIDFAFALTAARPLERPLPIAASADYQAELLKTALRQDHARPNRRPLAVQTLDWRVDVFSLGVLAEKILNAGLLVSGRAERTAQDRAERLIATLRGYDRDWRFWDNRHRPHARLIAELDTLLAGLRERDEAAEFQPQSLRPVAGTATPVIHRAAATPTAPRATPVTPVAGSPLPRHDPAAANPAPPRVVPAPPPAPAAPALPPVQDLHGWPADQVQALQRQTAAALGRPVVFRDRLQSGGEGPEMVVIPAGAFLMGSPQDEPGRQDDEGPQHRVTLAKPFAIGRYAVTFDDYDRFWQATGRAKPEDQGWGRGRRPVININWDEAQAYCAWLSEQSGRHYRLPSEAEWEYACRAGTVTPFCWGSSISPKQANYDGNYAYNKGGKGEYRQKTVAVDEFQPNAFGLYQMHGNVWEWCEDAWHGSYQGAPTDGSAWVASGEMGRRVLRGGSWYDFPRNLRSAFRFRGDSVIRNHGHRFPSRQDAYRLNLLLFTSFGSCSGCF